MWSLKTLKNVLSNCKDVASVAKVHAFMIISGHNNFFAQLVATYARTGSIKFARNVFDKIDDRRVDLWNAMIVAYSHKGQLSEVVNLYHSMVSEGVKPDSSTFTVTIKACTYFSNLEMGEEIRATALEFGYGNDLFVGSSLLNLYAKCGKMDKATSVFDKMPKRDIMCWTMMITGFAQCGRGVEAIDTYRTMRDEDIEGDEIVMLGLIQACTSIEDKRVGLSIHGYMIRSEICTNVVVQTSLVNMYSKIGDMVIASRVFKGIRNKNVISWSALISGFAQSGFGLDALNLLRDMQISGYEPDLASLISSLLACSQVGILKMGSSIHAYVLRRHDLDRITGTSLIDMYSKCGRLSSARALFDRINRKDLICWNTMIASYGIHGLGKDALSLVLEMRGLGLKPDHATFASLLSASSHSGLVEDGRYWFNLMVKEFNIRPSEKHYSCMVDLLARAGKVEEACDLIDQMFYEPGIEVWVALLSGCQIHRKFLIGEIAAKKIIELSPNEPGVYALVSNFFASARMWDEVAEIRKVMRERGIKKVPGYSAVEVNKKLLTFVMEDKSHSQYEDIVGILNKLEYEMREFKSDTMYA